LTDQPTLVSVLASVGEALPPLPAGEIAVLVLVADGEASRREALVALLHRLGHETVTAADGHAAVDLYSLHRPDMVFVDVNLPGLDGAIVAGRVKELRGPRWVPVVMLVPPGASLELDGAIAAGGDDYLHSPVEPVFLKAKLQGLQRLMQVRRQLSEATRQARDTERHFRSLLMSVPLPYQSLDPEGCITEVNLAWEQLTGVSRRDALGLPFRDLVEVAAQAASSGGTSADSGTPAVPLFELRHRGTGQRLIVEVHARPETNLQGGLLRTHCNLLDVTERVLATSERDAAISRLRIGTSVFASTHDAIMITDAGWLIVDVNPAFTENTGYTREEAMGRDPRFLSSGMTSPAVFVEMRSALAASDYWRGRVLNRHRNGLVREAVLTIAAVRDGADDSVTHYVGIIGDVTTELEDAVTGLAGLGGLTRKVEQLAARVASDGVKFALMQVGFDGFADVNAAYGFASGDLLLREAASRVQQVIPAGVSLFRVRGAEITVMVGEHASLEQIAEISEDLLVVVARPYEIAGVVTRVTASIGVALAPDDGLNATTLLSNAQSAMTAAREAGGNRIEFFQPNRNEDVQSRKRMGDDLHQALRGDQFRLLFQPIVNLATGKMGKAEALLRWHHPELGLVGPANFIGHAEKTGLIAEIGDWVILQSALAAKALRARWPDFQVHVNFSATQVLSRSFSLQRLLDVTQSVGIPPAALVLEFTESVLIEEESRVHHFLVEASAAGFQLAIDDFGSGYSSLAYLQRFDFDFVKIDKSFVRVAREASRKRDLCAAIVSIGRAMNVEVVAEGIETTDQCHRLAGVGCDWGQGYLFGRPMELAVMLEQR